MGAQEGLFLDRVGGAAFGGFVVEERFGGGVDLVVQHQPGHRIDSEREDVHSGLHVGAPGQSHGASLLLQS